MENLNLSIIVPFYHGERYIKRLLASFEKAAKLLTSDFKFEILLIIDSPSTNLNHVHDLVSPFEFSKGQLKVFKNEANIGVAKTRNKGLQQSNARYVYFIDQDDEVDEAFFQICDPVLQGSYEFVLLNGISKYADTRLKSNLYFYLKPSLDLKHLILDDIIRSPGQVILLRETLVGLQFPSPKKYFGADDKFFWIVIFLNKRNIRTYYIDSPLYIAHIHNENFSKDRSQLFLSGLELWDSLTQMYDTSDVQRYVKRNILYMKYVVRKHYTLSRREHIAGFCEYVMYFLRINRLIRYSRKFF